AVGADVPPERRAEAVAQDARGAEQLAQDDRPSPRRAVRNDAHGELEHEEPDPEGDVDEGEFEVGGQVAADPQRPERDPDRERRGGLIRVEATDARPQIGGCHGLRRPRKPHSPYTMRSNGCASEKTLRRFPASSIHAPKTGFSTSSDPSRGAVTCRS